MLERTMGVGRKTMTADAMRTWLAAAAALTLFSSAAVAHAAGTPAVYKSGDYQFEVAPAPTWIVTHDVPLTWDSAAPGASGVRWRNWLFDAQVDRRAGARERYLDSAYEAESSELIQNAGKYQIWFSPDHERLTIHRVQLRRDGAWQDRLVPQAITLARREGDFERDMSNGIVSALIVLNDVRVGDVVRVSYTISGSNPVLGGLVDEEFGFGAADPVLDRYARALYDSGTQLDEHGDAGAPKSHQKQEGRTLEWRTQLHGIAAIVNEGSYPSWYPVVPQIVVGARRSWADVAAWARSLYPKSQALPADLETRIAAWRQLKNDGARIDAALQSIQEDVRYFGTELGENTHRPSEPADTWNRRYGDCKDKARLLATVLNELGIEAHPALVSYDRGKSVAELPPAASLFDHVIVQARLDHATLWLDATQSQQRGSARLRSAGEFGVALPIDPTIDHLVQVTSPDGVLDRILATEHFTPDPANTAATLSIETRYEGAAADRIRRYITSEGIDEIRRRFLEHCRKLYGDAKFNSPLTFDDDAAHNALTVKQDYALANPWIAAGPGQQMVDVYSDAIGGQLELPKTSTRTAPLAVAHPTDIEQHTDVILPPGWRALSAASARAIKDAAMSFEYKIEPSEHALTLTQHYQSHSASIEPKDFAQHFALLREANELVGRRLSVGRSTKDAGHERDQRLQNLIRNILDDTHKPPAQGAH